MANFEIQNYLGEVVLPSVSQEELTVLIESKEHNYFEYDSNEENDLVTKWQTSEQHVVDFRIFKLIEE